MCSPWQPYIAGLVGGSVIGFVVGLQFEALRALLRLCIQGWCGGWMQNLIAVLP